MKEKVPEGGGGGCDGCGRGPSQRRTVLKAALGLGVSLPFLDVVRAAEKGPATQRPTTGDQLVFVLGDRKGEVIKVADLAVGGPQQLAYPMDPASKVVRDGSRLNQLLVIRLDPGEAHAQIPRSGRPKAS